MRYVCNLLVAMDQLVNTFFGGDPDETISSRLGKWARYRREKRGLKRPIYIIANFVVEIFQRDHFKKSIEEDEGKNKTIE